jgi:hypothetical protein
LAGFTPVQVADDPAADLGALIDGLRMRPSPAARRESDAGRRSGCADLGLERGREEERILSQLQGLGASIRRVRRDDDAVLELRGEMLVQAVAAIVKPSNGASPQIETSRVPDTGVTVRRSPYRLHCRATMTC